MTPPVLKKYYHTPRLPTLAAYQRGLPAPMLKSDGLNRPMIARCGKGERMAVAGTIVVALALLLGALNGFRRGALREGIALIGILLGVLLVTLWAERWGTVITQRTGWRPATGQWVAAMGLLWGTALLAGYGSASLLKQQPGKSPLVLRAGGLVLGLLNGGLLLSFSLRYTQALWYGETAGDPAPSWIRAAIASRFLLERIDLVLLGLGWTLAMLSLIVTVVRLVARLAAPQRKTPATTVRTQPSPVRQIPGAATSQEPAVPRPTVAPGMERSFIEKPRPPTPGQ